MLIHQECLVKPTQSWGTRNPLHARTAEHLTSHHRKCAGRKLKLKCFFLPAPCGSSRPRGTATARSLWPSSWRTRNMRSGPSYIHGTLVWTIAPDIHQQHGGNKAQQLRMQHCHPHSLQLTTTLDMAKRNAQKIAYMHAVQHTHHCPDLLHALVPATNSRCIFHKQQTVWGTPPGH